MNNCTRFRGKLSLFQKFIKSRTTACVLTLNSSVIKDTVICSQGSQIWTVRHYAQAKKEQRTSSSDLVKHKESPYAHLTPGQKVVQAGRDLTWTAVVIAGVVVTGFMFYMIGRELFSRESSSGVYGTAYKKCKRDPEVISYLGEPIKGYGEMTSRGRRRHVNHIEFESPDGCHHMRMKFYLEGPKRKGTVHLEVKKSDSGKYEYRYLFVELDGYPRHSIVIEDNR